MTELPKQLLLAKLLGMTDSASDNEALSAIRQANRLLKSAGWTWEQLIREKIKIVENPFAGLGDPLSDRPAEGGFKTATPPSAPPTPKPPPQPKPKPMPEANWTRNVNPATFGSPRPPHAGAGVDPWTFADGSRASPPPGAGPPPPSAANSRFQTQPSTGPKKTLRRRGGNPNNYRPDLGEL